MRLYVTHVHSLDEGQAERLLDFLGSRLGKFNRKLEAMMAKLEDVTNTLTGIGTAVDKISGETTQLLAKIAELEAVDPDQQAQIDAIAAQAQGIADRIKAVDDMVPDPSAPTA